MIIDKLEKAARFLVSEHKNNQSYKNLPQHLKPSNLDEAYQTQFIFHKLIERGPIGGRKVALVSNYNKNFLVLINRLEDVYLKMKYYMVLHS